MTAGAQLYTVREFCKTTDGFSRTLERVAEIGYKTVQVSGTCPFEPEWLKTELEKNGLKCVITHTPAERLINETKEVAREHGIFGTRYVGLGYYPFTDEESYDGFVKKYRRVAEELKNGGRYFMYHNHLQELRSIGGEIVLPRLAGDFAPEDMGFTLDTYWVRASGEDPAEWINKLSGRVPCIHLKDYAENARMAPVGEGSIDFEKVLNSASDSGTEYLLVEQDDCYGDDPFTCLERSYGYLNTLGIK